MAISMTAIQAATITVGPEGEYATIQAAVDGASSGDTISVKVLRIDPVRQRVGLSRRQALLEGAVDPGDDEEQDADDQGPTDQSPDE